MSDRDHPGCSGPTRRDALRVLGAGCGAAAAAMTVNGCTVAEVFIEPFEGEEVVFDINTADFEALKQVSGMVPVDAGGIKLVLIRTDEREFVALDRTCPHQSFDMSPSPAGVGQWIPDEGEGVLRCWAHNSSFDRTGKVVGGPSPSDLRSYAVSFDGPSGIGRIALPTAGGSPTAEMMG